MNTETDHKEWIFLGAILLLALALRLWGIGWGLPYLYQSEEYKVIKYALRMGGGDFNPHFFEYPSLYLYFILSVYGIYFVIGNIFGMFHSVQEFARLYVSDPTSFHLIGRGLETFFNVSAIAISYFIARAIFSRRTALFTALALAVLPSFTALSHVTKGDSAALCLGLAFWWFCLQIYETGKTKYYFLSGIFLGLSLSTKYYLLPLGIALPTAHFLSSQRKSFWILCASFCGVPIFFLAGTPFALSREFVQQFSSVLLNMNPSDPFWQQVGYDPFIKRMQICFTHLILMNQDINYFLISSLGFGIISSAGLIAFLSQKQKKFWLFAIPMVAVYFVVAQSWHPAEGYLRPIYPMFIMTGAYFLDRLIRRDFNYKILLKLRLSILIFAFFSVASALGESIFISHSYSLTDTRTEAKIWIEDNIPDGSKVLMDIAPISPPLEMTRAQLQKFYTRAVELNHYKKDYFRLKLESFKEGMKTYEIFWIKKSPSEIGSLPEQVEQVQQTQDLFNVEGTANDFENLKNLKIEYVITNNTAIEDAQQKIPRLKNFYATLKQKYQPIVTLAPKTKQHPGPTLQIYRIN